LSQDAFPGCGLHRRKPETLVFIMPDHELNQAVAEVTHTIEEQEVLGEF
jgi:hypothetical protein